MPSAVSLHARIQARYETVDEEGEPYVCGLKPRRAGCCFRKILPKTQKGAVRLINQLLTKKEITNVIDEVYRHCGQKETVLFADRMMGLGFKHACRAGISFGKDDLIIPDSKGPLVPRPKTRSRNTSSSTKTV